MASEVQESFDQVVPGASGRSNDFLGVVQKRCASAGIGIALQPTQPSRKQQRVVMKGAITFGNAWKGKRSYFLECYADPIGPSLQCGWQLTTNEVSGFIAHTDYGRRMDQKQTKIHNDPNTARQLNGILQSFHQMVFLPTLQDLINACGAQQQQSSGFLGA